MSDFYRITPAHLENLRDGAYAPSLARCNHARVNRLLAALSARQRELASDGRFDQARIHWNTIQAAIMTGVSTGFGTNLNLGARFKVRDYFNCDVSWEFRRGRMRARPTDMCGAAWGCRSRAGRRGRYLNMKNCNSGPEWVGTCVSLPVEDLNGFDDTARDITYRTFLRHLGAAIVHEIDADLGVPLRRDWHVRFCVGRWRGRRAVCLFHSAIHHIWTLP